MGVRVEGSVSCCGGVVLVVVLAFPQYIRLVSKTSYVHFIHFEQFEIAAKD